MAKGSFIALDHVIYGVQEASASSKGPKKYLIAEKGKRIWRNEWLITDRSKRAYNDQLKRQLAGWIRQMSANDIPSAIDTAEEMEIETASLRRLGSPRDRLRQEADIILSPKLRPRSPSPRRSKSPKRRKNLTYGRKKTKEIKEMKLKVVKTPRRSPSPKHRASPSMPAMVRSPVKTKTPAEKSLAVLGPKILSSPVNTGRPSGIFAAVKNLFTRKEQEEPTSTLPLSIVDANNGDELDWRTQGY